MNEPLVHRAVFGDVRGAHNLISATTGAPDTVLAELAWRYTDRLLPTEIAWQPYVCGYPFEEYYILTRTFAVRASRAGMVQTHALLIPIFDAGEISHLAAPLSLLPDEPTAALTSASLATAVQAGSPTVALSSPTMPVGFPAVARALLDGRTPVWVGQNDFDAIVCFLWNQLWPDARRALRFRVSAEPSDLDDNPSTIVCTPAALRVNWNPRYFVDQTAGLPAQPTPAEALILGLPEGRPLGDARERLQLPLASVASLKRLDSYVELLGMATTDSIRGAVRLLGSMAPRPDQAVSEKESVLRRLARGTSEGTEEDVLGLRNLDLSPYSPVKHILRAALSEWMRGCVKKGSGGVGMARETFLVKNVWAEDAREAIAESFTPWSRDVAALMWHWWSIEPALVRPVDPLVTSDASVEAMLITTMPSPLSADVSQGVLALAARREWYRLHAAVLHETPALESVEKFRSQLEVEPDTNERVGLELLATRVSAPELLKAALMLQAPDLVVRAAKSAIGDPSLMGDLQVSDPVWRTIWLHRLRAGGALFEGILQKATVAHALMDSLLGGANVDPDLLAQVMVHPDADLVAYPRRAELWQKLPEASLEHAQTVAAQAWLGRFAREPAFDSSKMEAALEACVISVWRAGPAVISADAVLRFWDRFGDALTEQDFLLWAEVSSTTWPSMAALAIGRAVLQRGWSRAASTLLRLARTGRDDAAVALRECGALLGFWDRAALSFVVRTPSVSEDEWWRSWMDLGVDLYPLGVSQNNIWEESGGEMSEVRGETGREQWSHSLNALRKGGAGRYITVEGLLHQMRRDFPNNPNLRLLEDLYLQYLRPRSRW